MIVQAVVDQILRNEGRNHNRGHSRPVPLECEMILIVVRTRSRIAGRDCRWRNRMIVEPTVFVPSDDLDLPPRVRQTVKAHLTVRCKFIVRRLVSTAELRS